MPLFDQKFNIAENKAVRQPVLLTYSLLLKGQRGLIVAQPNGKTVLLKEAHPIAKNHPEDT